MNGTIIDVPGITINVASIDMQDSTDTAHVIIISDGEKKVEIEINFGKIKSIK